MWSRIINPKTGRKVNINSKLGKNIIQNYLKIGGYRTFNCIQWQKEYLQDVCIQYNDICLNLCENTTFLADLFHEDDFVNLVEARKAINKLEIMKKNPKEDCEKLLKKSWETCSKDCFKSLQHLISKEITSTAYMLRLLTNSVITIDPNIKLIFVYNNQSLSGVWEEDCNKFMIKDMENKISRLIMGFGPSASGKTYWAKNIIKILYSSNVEFPKSFLTVDGGSAREFSEMYQYIIKTLEQTKLGGFFNLVTAGMGRTKSLFKSSKIKKSMIKYLKNQKNTGVKISLYVPITLGSCIKRFCYSSYEPFIDITRDNKWIGLIIYQHRKGLECPYKENYRCLGCTESGKLREKTEGKKYSSKAYGNSMSNGKYAIGKSIGGKIMIHNSGGYKYKEGGEFKFSKSIVTEYPVQGKYLLKSIPKEFNCIYLQEGVDKCIKE
jgi:hypothetical protein